MMGQTDPYQRQLTLLQRTFSKPSTLSHPRVMLRVRGIPSANGDHGDDCE
jgi:hypothetical protein